jgi:hypothetical protein
MPVAIVAICVSGFKPGDVPLPSPSCAYPRAGGLAEGRADPDRGALRRAHRTGCLGANTGRVDVHLAGTFRGRVVSSKATGQTPETTGMRSSRAASTAVPSTLDRSPGLMKAFREDQATPRPAPVARRRRRPWRQEAASAARRHPRRPPPAHRGRRGRGEAAQAVDRLEARHAGVARRNDATTRVRSDPGDPG